MRDEGGEEKEGGEGGGDEEKEGGEVDFPAFGFSVRHSTLYTRKMLNHPGASLSE